jgi:hypothetical protein
MSSDQKHIMRCAIYTRKSSEEGLEQSFNSLDAQREACEAFILSQKQEGWRAVASRYDDGGYSGGNMERPALKRLLEDIQASKVNIIVVYKVDRLTRSLALTSPRSSKPWMPKESLSCLSLSSSTRPRRWVGSPSTSCFRSHSLNEK